METEVGGVCTAAAADGVRDEVCLRPTGAEEYPCGARGCEWGRCADADE